MTIVEHGIATDPAVKRLRAAIRDVPDFPSAGIVYKDITPLLAHPALLRECGRLLAAPFKNDRVTHVAAIESRGFPIGALVAVELGAGLILVRKAGKLPRATVREEFSLEYGEATIEMHGDACSPTSRVLIVDDVLATGGTAAAAASLVRRCGAAVAGVSVMIHLASLRGEDRLADARCSAVVAY